MAGIITSPSNDSPNRGSLRESGCPEAIKTARATAGTDATSPRVMVTRQVRRNGTVSPMVQR